MGYYKTIAIDVLRNTIENCSIELDPRLDICKTCDRLIYCKAYRKQADIHKKHGLEKWE